MLAFEHHERNRLRGPDVHERITVHHEQRRAFLDRSEPRAAAQRFGRVQRRGLQRNQRRSLNDLLFVLLLAVVLVLILLLIEFGTFGAPAAILASALLST
jgi:multidrug efflux pump subunit AcrB